MTDRPDFTKYQRDLEGLAESAQPVEQSPHQLQFLESDREMLPESVQELATAESFEGAAGVGEDDQLQVLRDLLEEVRNLPLAVVEALRSS